MGSHSEHGEKTPRSRAAPADHEGFALTALPVGSRDLHETPTVAERLAHAIAVLRRRWLLASAIVLLATATGYALAAHGAKRYAARAQVVVAANDQVEGVALGGPNSGAQTDLERQANTDLALVKLLNVATEVRERLHVKASARALLSQVTTSYVGNSNIVGITAEDSDPARAAEIANAFATAYQSFRRETERAKLRAALNAARVRLVNLGPQGIDTPFGRLLQESINRLQVAVLVNPGSVTIAQYASAPKTVVSRRPTVAAFGGFIIGCVLAALVLALLERLDDRLHNEQEVARAFRRAPLARLVLGRSSSARVNEQRDFARLAARILAARGERSVLLVGSPTDNPGAGRVTIGLAAALSHVGKRVIAIDAHARPQVNGDEAAEPWTGLAAILTGRSFLDDELRLLVPDEQSDGPSVEVLPSGRLIEGHELVAGGKRLRDVVQQAARQADVVIIGAPPLLRGAEPVSLLAVADTVLVIADIGQTTGAEATETLELLDATGADMLGLVATRGGRKANDLSFHLSVPVAPAQPLPVVETAPAEADITNSGAAQQRSHA